ncbi:MAG: transcription-repair coupling factor [Paludibacteraceae bacterium]|nr:transcription-repair coupling factor [Paludibacteraceae bacterium]
MNRILDIVSKSRQSTDTLKWLKQKSLTLRYEGLFASERALILASLIRKSKLKLIAVMDDADTASYLYNDLATLLDNRHLAVLPSAYRKSPKHGETDIAAQILRTDALNIISSSDSYIVVTSPAGIAELVTTKQTLNSSRILLRPGDVVEPDDIVSRLEGYNFEEVEFVYQPGQYSVRGSILDIFSYTNERPYRIDFFGNEIESIRTFDIEKQLSLDHQERADILPDTQSTIEQTNLISILNFIDQDTVIFYSDFDHTLTSLGNIYEDALEGKRPTLKPERFFDDAILHKTILLHRSNRLGEPSSTISFNISPQPLFHKDFDMVADTLKNLQADGYTIYICSDSVKQTDRIAAIFHDRGDNISFTPIARTLHEGFTDNDARIACFTDHQIFDRFHRFSLRSDIAKAGRAAMTLKEINELQRGDFVVHSDHGIGRFEGLCVIEDNGHNREVIKLSYRDNDTVYVSIHNLHKVSKYKSKDGEPPQISKLGSGAWDRLKERTKSKIKDIARDLIRLYAARGEEKGFQFSPDDYMQHELEASFLYEDTPDQAKATSDIKKDMESAKPMDRLICGDVGFGKTELAIRAAFKAVLSGKQVALLVPTTVLAFQHFNTFTERLRKFPVRIEYLSRAKKTAEVKKIKTMLEEGKIDILIGTHKIVGKDIKFKDLGLLIIDEEQKFGVSVKEKLKQMRVNVDTLTLTATPIPRTLQFSLMGARDLSVLSTPPPNRYPVMTEVSTWDPILIADAINTELNRNGQVFVINNRINNIDIIAQKIRKLVPSARIAIAHGQMPTDELEQTLLDFMEYDYDVLIATSVIESGIDIPNVNTMIVNNAHMFGLSDLHQLRGRVGRSNRKAYCYLIAPDFDFLTPDARARLKAIETFSDLGSGFSIAMQDLDIRGAGNILGAEQSGFITDLGYETYQQILSEALIELHTECGNSIPALSSPLINHECNIETDLEIMLPSYYVSSQTERVVLYRELDSIQTEEALAIFKERLVDRFGDIPESVESLFDMVRLRWRASALKFDKLILRNGRMFCHLPEQGSNWYDSDTFTRILEWSKEKTHRARIESKNNKGILIIENAHSTAEALSILNHF